MSTDSTETIVADELRVRVDDAADSEAIHFFPTSDKEYDAHNRTSSSDNIASKSKNLTSMLHSRKKNSAEEVAHVNFSLGTHSSSDPSALSSVTTVQSRREAARSYDAMMLAKANHTAIIAAKAVFASGGSQETAAKTARAAARSVLEASDYGKHADGRHSVAAGAAQTLSSPTANSPHTRRKPVISEYLRRRMIKRHAEVISSVATVTAASALRNANNDTGSDESVGAWEDDGSLSVKSQQHRKLMWLQEKEKERQDKERQGKQQEIQLHLLQLQLQLQRQLLNNGKIVGFYDDMNNPIEIIDDKEYTNNEEVLETFSTSQDFSTSIDKEKTDTSPVSDNKPANAKPSTPSILRPPTITTNLAPTTVSQPARKELSAETNPKSPVRSVSAFAEGSKDEQNSEDLGSAIYYISKSVTGSTLNNSTTARSPKSRITLRSGEEASNIETDDGNSIGKNGSALTRDSGTVEDDDEEGANSTSYDISVTSTYTYDESYKTATFDDATLVDDSTVADDGTLQDTVGTMDDEDNTITSGIESSSKGNSNSIDDSDDDNTEPSEPTALERMMRRYFDPVLRGVAPFNYKCASPTIDDDSDGDTYIRSRGSTSKGSSVRSRGTGRKQSTVREDKTNKKQQSTKTESNLPMKVVAISRTSTETSSTGSGESRTNGKVNSKNQRDGDYHRAAPSDDDSQQVEIIETMQPGGITRCDSIRSGADVIEITTSMGNSELLSPHVDDSTDSQEEKAEEDFFPLSQDGRETKQPINSITTPQAYQHEKESLLSVTKQRGKIIKPAALKEKQNENDGEFPPEPVTSPLSMGSFFSTLAVNGDQASVIQTSIAGDDSVRDDVDHSPSNQGVHKNYSSPHPYPARAPQPRSTSVGRSTRKLWNAAKRVAGAHNLKRNTGGGKDMQVSSTNE